MRERTPESVTYRSPQICCDFLPDIPHVSLLFKEAVLLKLQPSSSLPRGVSI